MNTDRRVRAAVIGLGVGEQHARAYWEHPDCSLVALCDRNPVRLGEVGASFPGVRLVGGVDELFRDCEFDVVSIASYDDGHHKQVIAALRRGSHVFVEKPLCLNRAQLVEIGCLLASDQHLQLSSNLVLRREPRFIDLRERIRSGMLGDLFLLSGSYDYGRLHKLHSGWRGRIVDYSVMHGGGIHLIDLLCWLHPVPVVDVVAVGSSVASRMSGFGGDDLTLALLRFADGAVGQVAANFASVAPHHHLLSVYGTKATFVQSHTGCTYMSSRDASAPREPVDDPYPAASKGALVWEFLESLLGRATVAVDAREVLTAMAVSIAAQESVSSGHPVSVDEILSLDGLSEVMRADQ